MVLLGLVEGILLEVFLELLDVVFKILYINLDVLICYFFGKDEFYVGMLFVDMFGLVDGVEC